MNQKNIKISDWLKTSLADDKITSDQIKTIDGILKNKEEDLKNI